MLRTTKPSSLAFAVRDGVPFANLKDEAVEALAVTVTGYEKALTELVAKLAEQPTPAAETAAASTAKEAPAARDAKEKKPVKPDEVIPPAKEKRA